jgi:aminoglycoside phosphotransferase family enzyme/predicted kinase
MSKTLPLLIAALLEPGRYPHPAQQVELIETHASWLLLAGAFAYKIKKSITLPFLDYGTLDKRRACCLAELQLNRRFAPELYLGVVAVLGTPENPRFSDKSEDFASSEVLEFAVRMHRFAEAGRLDHLCSRGLLEPAHISALAEALVDFHGIAAIASGETRFGAPLAVSAAALENFTELLSLLSDTASQERLQALHVWTKDECRKLAAHFVRRKVLDRVRECHGDLHLGNLVVIDGCVTLFDCIEFNEDFRWIDVASEVAFTYVDLLDHRQPGLAGWLLNEWLLRSGDYDALTVLRFYAVYRALVRAKVAAISAEQGRGDGNEIQGYMALAECLAIPPKPRLMITHGLAGCGKTRASTRQILGDPHAATLRLRSDVERKRLFGLNATEKSGSPIDGGIYGQEANRRTYQRLYELTRQALAAGWSVVVDAAFLKRAERDAFRTLANDSAVAFFIFAPQASPEQLRERILARLAKGRDASEATPEVLEKQMSWIEALAADERVFLLSEPCAT